MGRSCVAYLIAILLGAAFADSVFADTAGLPQLPPIEEFGAEQDEILLTPQNRGYAIAAARLAARYMAGSVSEEGQFAYEFDFLRNTWSEGDNIVRQAGALSVLGAYLATLGRDPVVEAALLRAIVRLEQKSLRYQGGLLVSQGDDLSGAETGATALALHGEVLYASATGDDRFAATRAAWLTALAEHWDPILGMRRSPVRNERSPYFDGEAWLALATYVDQFPDDPVGIELLASMDDALMAHYTATPNVSFFHWGELAARQRHRTTGDRIFVGFAAEQAKIFRTEFRPHIDPLNNTCFSVEGLAAAWWLLIEMPELADFRAELRNRVLNEQYKNALMQIRPGQSSFAPVDGVTVASVRMREFAGAYLNGRHRLQTRIDSTQHCLNAWLQMLK